MADKDRIVFEYTPENCGGNDIALENPKGQDYAGATLLWMRRPSLPDTYVTLDVPAIDGLVLALLKERARIVGRGGW